MAKVSIKVDARLFAAVAQVQSTEETRYYLIGVYVCPHPLKGALMVATDGHRMMVAHDPDGECSKPAICSLPKEALSLKFKEPTVALKIEIDLDGIATLATFRSDKSVFVDGTYPDWVAVLRPTLELARRRFHGKEVNAPASFNGDYLGSFGKIAKILVSQKTSVAVRVVSFTESDPALILFPREPHAFGVLMPMRAAVEGNALPLFMKEVLEPPTLRKSKRKAT